MTGILVKKVESDREFRAAMAIQEAVFVAEQGIPADLTLDATNSHAIHVLAMHADQPVGTARLDVGCRDCAGSGTIARVAVLPAHRKAGIGRRMVVELEDIGRRAGVTRFLLHPHVYLEGFYQALGYERTPDGDHVVAGHPLITMKKTATRHPENRA
jgi:predicted GNAT family N-acyltransferase